VQIEPLGKTENLGSHLLRHPEGESYNQLYYRLPDVVDLKVKLGSDVLSNQRISIFQSGAVITTPINW